jgi:hypothetical protein
VVEPNIDEDLGSIPSTVKRGERQTDREREREVLEFLEVLEFAFNLCIPSNILYLFVTCFFETGSLLVTPAGLRN